ncbi:hypothetical protein TNCV_2741671 [Trichonephila clavipes]|nr:hypothetical protein TNCV_2741671 [Trichonephila clavipes]
MWLPKTLITPVPFWIAETGYRMGERNVLIFVDPEFLARLGDLDVECPPRKSKVAGSLPAGVDRFSGCENEACHMIMRHVKDTLSISLALVLWAKLKS